MLEACVPGRNESVGQSETPSGPSNQHLTPSRVNLRAPLTDDRQLLEKDKENGRQQKNRIATHFTYFNGGHQSKRSKIFRSCQTNRVATKTVKKKQQQPAATEHGRNSKILHKTCIHSFYCLNTHLGEFFSNAVPVLVPEGHRVHEVSSSVKRHLLIARTRKRLLLEL